MKFASERDQLVEALTTAGRAVNPRSAIAGAMGGIRLEVRGNRLALVGTDLDLTVTVDIGVGGLDDGVCVAPARLVSDIVRTLEPSTVTFAAADDDLEITADRARFVVRTYPVADFPSVAEHRPAQVTFPAGDLAEALRQVVPAASTDDTRQMLTGVLFVREPTGLRLVATDSYRIAWRDLPSGVDLPDDTEQVLVPARTLREIQRLLASSAKELPASTLGFSSAEHDATFSTDGVHLTTRLLAGSFPDYRKLVPPEYPTSVRVDKVALLDALRRVKLLVSDDTTPVRLTISENAIDLAVQSQDVGYSSDTVTAHLEGEEATVAFKPAYLIDGVEAVAGDEVILDVLGATKPTTVRCEGHDEYRYLLMPIRTS